jgi:molecular chaperone HscB
MRYFELFDMPVQFNPDPQLLRKKFFELSALTHPDRFANASPEEQERSLEDSAMVNKAYKTLTNEDETMKYILQEKEVLVTDEKYALPPEFLMEMMDLNDELPEAMEDEAKKAGLMKNLKRIQYELYLEIKPVIDNYGEGATSNEELLKVKDYYFKKKYLLRIAQQLGQKL